MIIDSSYKEIRRVFETYGTRKTFPKDGFIFQRTEPSRYVGFILSGQARTVISNQNGDELTLFYLGENNLIGSEGLLKKQPTFPIIVSVQAITDVEALLLPKDKFWDIWDESGLDKYLLIEHLVMRITTLSDYICCSHFRDNKKRVAYFLHSTAMMSGMQINHSNEQIAAITGVNRVSINRILNGFAKEGILSLDYRRITILDLERLRTIYDSLGYFDDVGVQKQ